VRLDPRVSVGANRLQGLRRFGAGIVDRALRRSELVGGPLPYGIELSSHELQLRGSLFALGFKLPARRRAQILERAFMLGRRARRRGLDRFELSLAAGPLLLDASSRVCLGRLERPGGSRPSLLVRSPQGRVGFVSNLTQHLLASGLLREQRGSGHGRRFLRLVAYRLGILASGSCRELGSVYLRNNVGESALRFGPLGLGRLSHLDGLSLSSGHLAVSPLEMQGRLGPGTLEPLS